MNAFKAYKRRQHTQAEQEREKTLNLLAQMSDDELKEWSDKQFAKYESLKQ